MDYINKKEFYTGNESIFLNQFYKSGKTLDFGYLYGERNNKTFIGFKMKCYFKNTDLSKDIVDKCKIRKDCQKILINSMKLFNCKITKWCYYLVFYYNSKDPSENINQNDLNKCEKNNIGYFFYEPIEKKFYYTVNDQKILMDELNIDENADLDNCVINAIDYSNNNINSELKIKMGKEINEMKNSFVKDFSNLFNKNVSTLYILYRIGIILKLKDFDIKFISKFKFSNYYFFPPDKDFIFLYKNKSANKFIASFKKDKKGEINTFVEIPTGKILQTIYDVLDVNCDYYYCLKKSKKIIIKAKKIKPTNENKNEDIKKIANISDINYY